MSDDKKYDFYVVFEGRKPGIYLSWPACSVQVNRYKGNRYKGYHTYHEAEKAWLADRYGENHVDVTPNHEVGSSSRPSASQKTPPMERMPSPLAEDIGSNDFVLQHSMQTEVDIVCSRMGIQRPTYTVHEVRVIDGVEYRRYGASLVIHASSKPVVCVGRWGKEDHEEAKEDAAALLLRKLMAATGKKIRDYNHYNVVMLESQLNTIMDEKLELEMEISMLNGELRMTHISGDA